MQRQPIFAFLWQHSTVLHCWQWHMQPSSTKWTHCCFPTAKIGYTNAPQRFIIHTLPILLLSTSGIKCFTELNIFIDALKSNHLVTKGEVVGSCKHGSGATVCQKMWATSWLAQQLYTFHERGLAAWSRLL